MNKLGPQVINPTQQAVDWVRKAPVVKSLGNPHTLKEAPPGAITVYRLYLDGPTQDSLDYGSALAQIFTTLDNFRPTYIEVFNETHQLVGAGLEQHVEAMRHCVQAINNYGSKVAGFSFSTGQPELRDWLYLQQQGFAGVQALATHEYWGCLPFSDWNPLRHRRIHSWLGGIHPPFIITECGRDAVVQDGTSGKPGWKLQGITGENYAKELIAYDAELEKDPYVLGATVFTAGPTPDWNNFDTDGLSQLLPAWGGIKPVTTTWKLAFADYAKLHPEQVGVPTTDIMYDDQGNAWQYSTKGMLFSAKGLGWKVFWFPKA